MWTDEILHDTPIPHQPANAMVTYRVPCTTGETSRHHTGGEWENKRCAPHHTTSLAVVVVAVAVALAVAVAVAVVQKGCSTEATA